MNCPWCDKPMTERRGKRFCRPACKNAMHAAEMLVGRREIEAGRVSIDDARNLLAAQKRR